LEQSIGYILSLDYSFEERYDELDEKQYIKVIAYLERIKSEVIE
jgi:hypothetical protein